MVKDHPGITNLRLTGDEQKIFQIICVVGMQDDERFFFFSLVVHREVTVSLAFPYPNTKRHNVPIKHPFNHNTSEYKLSSNLFVHIFNCQSCFYEFSWDIKMRCLVENILREIDDKPQYE